MRFPSDEVLQSARIVAQALTGELTGYAVSTAEVAGLARAFLELCEAYRVPELADLTTLDSHPPFITLKVSDLDFLRMLHPVTTGELASMVRSSVGPSGFGVLDITSPSHLLRLTASDPNWVGRVQDRHLVMPRQADARVFMSPQGARLVFDRNGWFSIDWLAEVYRRKPDADGKLVLQHRGYFCDEFEAGEELALVLPPSALSVVCQHESKPRSPSERP